MRHADDVGHAAPMRFRFRHSIGRYGLVILGCVSSISVSLIFCLNSCDPTLCSYQPCSDQVKQSPDPQLQRGWIGTYFSAEKPKFQTFLLILIFTAPQNMEQRDTIRQTWLKLNNHGDKVLHYFAVGSGRLDEDERRTLASENTRFNDILLLPNVNDSYYGLTQKLLAALVWLHHNVDFNFLLKVDDDSFVQINMAMEELLSVKTKQKLYWGYFNGKAHIQKRGLWHESDWLLCDYYLPYALGGGYVISSDLVRFVGSNQQYLKLFNSEDVSLGAWLAPIDVYRVHDLRFDTAAVSRGCSNSYIVTHKQSVYEMREKFWSLQERGKMCQQEVKRGQSYIYNWKVPPSKCCKRNETLLL